LLGTGGAPPAGGLTESPSLKDKRSATAGNGFWLEAWRTAAWGFLMFRCMESRRQPITARERERWAQVHAQHTLFTYICRRLYKITLGDCCRSPKWKRLANTPAERFEISAIAMRSSPIPPNQATGWECLWEVFRVGGVVTSTVSLSERKTVSRRCCQNKV